MGLACVRNPPQSGRLLSLSPQLLLRSPLGRQKRPWLNHTKAPSDGARSILAMQDGACVPGRLKGRMLMYIDTPPPGQALFTHRITHSICMCSVPHHRQHS